MPTVVELKKELRKRGLDEKGKKAELEARLAAHDAEQDEPAPAEEEAAAPPAESEHAPEETEPPAAAEDGAGIEANANAPEKDTQSVPAEEPMAVEPPAESAAPASDPAPEATADTTVTIAENQPDAAGAAAEEAPSGATDTDPPPAAPSAAAAGDDDQCQPCTTEDSGATPTDPWTVGTIDKLGKQQHTTDQAEPPVYAAAHTGLRVCTAAIVTTPGSNLEQSLRKSPEQEHRHAPHETRVPVNSLSGAARTLRTQARKSGTTRSSVSCLAARDRCAVFSRLGILLRSALQLHARTRRWLWPACITSVPPGGRGCPALSLSRRLRWCAGVLRAQES